MKLGYKYSNGVQRFIIKMIHNVAQLMHRILFIVQYLMDSNTDFQWINSLVSDSHNMGRDPPAVEGDVLVGRSSKMY